MSASKPTEKWVGYKVGLIIALLGALVFLLYPRQKTTKHVPIWRSELQARQAAESLKEKHKRFRDIIQAIARKGQFPSQDEQFALRCAQGNDVTDSAQGILILSAASTKGLFPKEKVAPIIEAKEQESSGVGAGFHMVQYRYLYELSPYWDKEHYDEVPLSGGPTAFTQTDKDFVKLMLKDAKAANRALAAFVLASKKGLNQTDKDWAIEQASSQLDEKDTSERKYWEFVLKMVRAKS